MKIPFTKMHGCGNDYIYVDVMLHPIADPEACAIAWSDRHKGIGSDGLVLIGRSPIVEADYSMRIFNADGSEAMMCGNASRCIGKYLYEKGITEKTEIRLLTLSGVKHLYLHLAEGRVGAVTVDMGEPIFEDETLFTPTLEKSLSAPLHYREESGVGLQGGTFVSMGNPHYVIFTDNIDQVGATGRILEHHPAFPQRCNIEFAQVLPDHRIRTRVWERGSGITEACGTGACATGVAACLQGRSGRKSQIVMDGGTLGIEWCESDRSEEGHVFQKNHVYMTGPAEFVFDGEIECP
ncbi:MAG: diaminopimelate epimerase [Prevotella sp.]|nr:diaminopimelate epimerase [Prevotella sp.]